MPRARVVRSVLPVKFTPTVSGETEGTRGALGVTKLSGAKSSMMAFGPFAVSLGTNGPVGAAMAAVETAAVESSSTVVIALRIMELITVSLPILVTQIKMH